MRAVKFLLVLMISTSVWAVTQPAEQVTFKPSLEQRLRSNLATKFLANWHYKDTRLDDELSEKIFDGYLNLLDPNYSFFLASDIETFAPYRLNLDDALQHSDPTPAYEMFNVYVERVRERVVFAREQLKQPMDFTIDESYMWDRDEIKWANSEEELNEFWRQRVKNDYLRLRLADKDDEAIIETLDDRYANLDRRISELNSDDIFQFFMNAFAQSIEPHTAYMSPRSSENFEISMRLSLEGIGALLGRENEYTSIASVVPGGPADKEGNLKAGDKVLAVGQGKDGKLQDVVGWRVDDVVDLIRGAKHTIVRLEVLHEDTGVEGPSETIEIVRDEVKLEEQAAKSRIIEVPGDNEEVVKVGVIDLPVFYLDFNGRAKNLPDYRSSTRDVRRLIDEMKAEGITGLIIDLRNNGGGSLLEATTLTGLFIDEGPVVQVRNSSGRISTEEDTDPGMAWDGPLAVLVNRYSASASEIFAAAIQDYGRGLIIGETTFGKGTVQNLVDLDDYAPSSDAGKMGQLKITMAQFFRVNGGSTQNRGVEPDIRFPSAGDPEDYGERSLENALPWTSIPTARYEREGEMDRMVAVTDFRYQHRITSDQEFGWLLSDVEEFNLNKDKKEISLLESSRREEMDKDEAKRTARKAAKEGNGPLLDEADSLVGAGEPPEAAIDDVDEETAEDADEEEEDLPDLLLRESARIVYDMIELGRDEPTLARQFSLLGKEEAAESIN
ncbi:MAG: carboxy terminal-processing peptidase [Xanthomonadales bacterium]|nr:carboxy terminal-processing peptidase [Xanthomonadales bacterium]